MGPIRQMTCTFPGIRITFQPRGLLLLLCSDSWCSNASLTVLGCLAGVMISVSFQSLSI